MIINNIQKKFVLIFNTDLILYCQCGLINDDLKKGPGEPGQV